MCCLSVCLPFLQVPTSCPGVPAVLLQPALQWADKADFNDTLSQLAALFVKNFKVRERERLCCLSSSNAGGGRVKAVCCRSQRLSSQQDTAQCCHELCNSGKSPVAVFLPPVLLRS